MYRYRHTQSKMGKKKGKEKWSRKNKKQRTEDTAPEWRSMRPDERFNPKWEAYYKAQNIVPEEEWKAFKDAFGVCPLVSSVCACVCVNHDSTTRPAHYRSGAADCLPRQQHERRAPPPAETAAK